MVELKTSKLRDNFFLLANCTFNPFPSGNVGKWESVARKCVLRTINASKFVCGRGFAKVLPRPPERSLSCLPKSFLNVFVRKNTSIYPSFHRRTGHGSFGGARPNLPEF